MCHIFLLLPLFGLPLFLILPWEEALPLYVGVGVLSAAFYSLLWRAMRRPASTGIEGMMGGVGTVFRCRSGVSQCFQTDEGRGQELPSCGLYLRLVHAQEGTSVFGSLS